jgi:hypothetical protein
MKSFHASAQILGSTISPEVQPIFLRDPEVLLRLTSNTFYMMFKVNLNPQLRSILLFYTKDMHTHSGAGNLGM